MKTSGTDDFYASLPVLDSFFEISKPQNFHSLPADWYVGVTDIKNSTKAIAENKYKRVNILGASPIIGIMNETNRADLPYTFGGDGCAICFPAKFKSKVEKVFEASRAIGETEYGLQLRIAVIPVKDIYEHGYKLNVARFKVSPAYSQAVFNGGGLSYAEELMKEDTNSLYQIESSVSPSQADFSGLECRWQEVNPDNKSVISVLVQCNPSHPQPEKVYDKVLARMREIFGFDDKTNPVVTEELKMHLSPPALMHETKFRTYGQNWLKTLGYLLKVELQTILGKLFMKLGYKSSQTDWSRYKADLSLNSDHRKFDDMLRLVISATAQQAQEFEHFLEELHQNATLAFGIHHSESAVVTCMVFAYERNHIHFVDGSDGGYVQAAKSLKKRLKKLEKQAVN